MKTSTTLLALLLALSTFAACGGDPCGAVGTWTFTCPPISCGSCGLTGGNPVTFSVPAEVAANGGDFSVEGTTLHFSGGSMCSINLGSSACNLPAGTAHFSWAGAYIEGIYKCDCTTCGTSICPGVRQ